MHPDPMNPTALFWASDGTPIRPPLIWTCHWPGCRRQIERSFVRAGWACEEHWSRLPRQLRIRLLANYERGQDFHSVPNDLYLLASMQALQWIFATEQADGVPPELQREYARRMGRLIQQYHAEE